MACLGIWSTDAEHADERGQGEPFSSASVEFEDGKAHIRTCFTAGTKIKTQSGYKSIETIQTGDIVASANEHTGKISYKKVVQTFIRQAPRIYKLTYKDGTSVETTGDHPFFIQGKGWTHADSLANGDISPTWTGLKNSNGVVEKEIAFSESKDTISDRVSRLVMKESLAVVDIEVIEEETTVYNFEVEDDHTYFVTEAELWVHNAPTEYQKGYEYGVRKSLVANADVIPLAINSAASNMNAGISGNSDQLELPMFSDLYDKSVRSKELSKSNDPAEFERGFEDGNFFGNVSQFAISLPIAIRSLKNALGLRFTKPIATPIVQQEVKAGLDAAKGGMTAYETALAGGKHSCFLKNYMGRSADEMNKAIRSMQTGKEGISVHLDKLANPTKYVPDWNTLRPGHQQSLINGWQNTVTKHTEQIQILQTLLGK